MPTRNTHERDIGALQATVAMLAQAVEKQGEQHSRAITQFESMVKEAHGEVGLLRTEIQDMKQVIAQARGGVKVLVGVGTVSAAAGALITKLAGMIFPIFPR